MKKNRLTLTYVSFVFLSFSLNTLSKNNEHTLKLATSFKTANDLSATRGTSNVSLKNRGTTSATLYGVYIVQLAYVAVGQACSSATVLYNAAGKISAGSMVFPVSIDAGKEAIIGPGFLYNMIYGAQYYGQIMNFIPPGCMLPGCTWGADSTLYNWCIYLGAMAPVSVTNTYTSKVSPSSSATSGGGYRYDVISDYNYLGPISCNDQTLTCSVDSAQTQNFSL